MATAAVGKAARSKTAAGPTMRSAETNRDAGKAASAATPSGSAESVDSGVSEQTPVSDTPSAPTGAQKGSQSPQQPSKKSAAPTIVIGKGGGGAVSSGAGFLLGLAFWAWVALPFLKDGPQGVKNMLKAKFLNKAPDGSWLP